MLLLLLLLAPFQALAGPQPDLLVRLASEGDASYLGAGVFEAVAALQSKTQAAFPGTPASYRVRLVNAGDLPDSFQLRAVSAAGVQVRFLDPLGTDLSTSFGAGFSTPVLAPGQSLDYQVQVTPAGFTLGASFRVTVQADSAADPSRVDQVKAETVACSSSAALTLSAPPDAQGAPGSTVVYPYTVTNVGNTDNAFTLSLAGPDGWPGALYADDGAGGGTAGDGVRQPGETTPFAFTGPLPPGGSSRFFLVVTVPASGSNGSHADTQLFAAGQGASAADQVTTSAVSAALSVAESVRNLTRGGAFAPGAEASPGDTLEYRMAVTNSGGPPATGVTLKSPLPSNTRLTGDAPWIGASAGGEGGCPAASCGTVRSSGGSLLALVGQGAGATTGGSLPPGTTLYVFFRVQVE